MTQPAWDTRPVETLTPLPPTPADRLRHRARAAWPAIVLVVLVIADTVADVLLLTGMG